MALVHGLFFFLLLEGKTRDSGALMQTGLRLSLLPEGKKNPSVAFFHLRE